MGILKNVRCPPFIYKSLSSFLISMILGTQKRWHGLLRRKERQAFPQYNQEKAIQHSLLEKNDLTSNREDSPGPGLPAAATGLIKEGATRGEVIFNDNFPLEKGPLFGYMDNELVNT
ncbi:MAG: hypothetical protein ACOX3E_08790 [Desulfomonilia bacterium]|jgi:hypothetical protein|nr:hypothetical protein [Desulfomonilia bacterium]HRV34417.1 hypothetical protein [Desulfomonilia bacterium]